MPKSIIVLDLDKTLIYSTLERIVLEDVLPVTSIEVKGNIFYVHKRPRLNEFLEYIDNIFEYVVIWTAGILEYAEKIVDVAYTNGNRPDFVFARNDCDFIDNEYVKDLSKVIDVLESGYKKKDILMIEDNLSFILRNGYNSSYKITEYCPQNFFEIQNDDQLYDLMSYINSIKS